MMGAMGAVRDVKHVILALAIRLATGVCAGGMAFGSDGA